MADSVYYEELTPRQFRKRIADAPVAYLPLGTLEWHGEHLPLGSDGFQSRGFFTELAKDVGGIVLPMLFLGPDLRVTQNNREFYGMDVFGFLEAKDNSAGNPELQTDEESLEFVPAVMRKKLAEAHPAPRQLDGSAYRVSNQFFHQLLENILRLLKRAGFQIVVAHGHGPSVVYFARHLKCWEQEFKMKLFTCWRTDEEEADGLGIQTDHAAANETSLMMVLHPGLVEMENLDPDPANWPTAVSGDDPRFNASPERGSQSIRVQSERMKKLLRAALVTALGGDRENREQRG